MHRAILRSQPDVPIDLDPAQAQRNGSIVQSAGNMHPALGPRAQPRLSGEMRTSIGM